MTSVLVVDPDLPDCLERSAHYDGTVMAVRHRELPAEGVQFHPESVLTPEGGVPTLGVCLGHQAMVEAFGGRTIRGEPIHGKDAEVEHDSRTIFERLPNPLAAGRYHSLVADPGLPDELELTSSYGDVVMGVRHRELPAEGVQFHPESVLTPQGKKLLSNFLAA